MNRKKYLSIISLFLILMITVMSSCTVSGNDSDPTANAPQKTPMFIENFRPLTTGGIPAPSSSKEPDINAYDSIIYYGGYDSGLPQATLITYSSFDAFNSEVLKKLQSNDGNYHVNSSDPDKGEQLSFGMFDMFDEEYFEEHFVLAIRLTLSGGSVKAALSKIASDGDLTKIYLTSITHGDAGTCDMVSVHILIGLSIDEYDIKNKTAVFMNGIPIQFSPETGETM